MFIEIDTTNANPFLPPPHKNPVLIEYKCIDFLSQDVLFGCSHCKSFFSPDEKTPFRESRNVTHSNAGKRFDDGQFLSYLVEFE